MSFNVLVQLCNLKSFVVALTGGLDTTNCAAIASDGSACTKCKASFSLDTADPVSCSIAVDSKY